MTPTLARIGFLLVLLAVFAGGTVAGADDTAITAEEPGLEAALAKDPTLVLLMGLLRFGTAFVGAWLVVRGYRRWSRRRADLAPPALPGAGAKTVTSLPTAVFVLFLWILLPSLLVHAFTRLWPDLQGSMALTVVTMAIVALPLVIGYAMRRRALRTDPALPPAQVVSGGFLTFCIGNAYALPALFVGAAILHSMGEEVTTYGVVEQAVDPAHPENLWITAFLAVIVAPLVEETIFRGMLYPAMRDAAGGGRRAAWIAAIIVSAIFAAFHGHAPSFLPLFALAMVLTFVFEKTNSLSTVVLAHAFFNAASMIPLLIARSKGLL